MTAYIAAGVLDAARDFFESRARTWGRFAGTPYAQAFYSPQPLKIDNMMEHLLGIRSPMDR